MNPNGAKRTAMEVAKAAGDMSGKIFLVTGAYSGIGVETTKALLTMKGKVILAGRNEKTQKEFVNELKKTFDESLIDGGATLDLGNLSSVKTFADYVLSNYEKLDVLLLNAGVMMCPKGVTKDGFETQMGVNCIGHFLLAKKLLPIVKAANGRQVWVSSLAHTMEGAPAVDVEYYRNFDMEKSTYNQVFAYQQSKLGNILLAKQFTKRHDIEAVSLHPGAINTNLGRHLGLRQIIPLLFRFMFNRNVKVKSAAAGAATSVTCATLPSEKLINGGYYDDCDVGKPTANVDNEENAAALYDYCDEVTKKFE